ncbi:hypothetical protein WAJ05_20265, partial [Acinetobacter baumannii]
VEHDFEEPRTILLSALLFVLVLFSPRELFRVFCIPQIASAPDGHAHAAIKTAAFFRLILARRRVRAVDRLGFGRPLLSQEDRQDDQHAD